MRLSFFESTIKVYDFSQQKRKISVDLKEKALDYETRVPTVICYVTSCAILNYFRLSTISSVTLYSDKGSCSIATTAEPP